MLDTGLMIGGMVLLFGGSFAAVRITAAAMVGATVPLVTLQIADALSGNVLVVRLREPGAGVA